MIHKIEELALKTDVITGFSYSFCSVLLKKLMELKRNNQIFEDENEKNKLRPLTAISYSILNHLQNQLNSGNMLTLDPRQTSIDEVNQIIDTTEEFLVIFESSGEIKVQPE